MRILFGIGNPGKKYSLNRHNAGFMLLDYFAETHSITFKPSKFDFYFAQGELSDVSYALVKPANFVNNSGIAAEQVFRNFDMEIKDFLVVYDELNLQFPISKIKISGGDGGHNGLNSIIYHLNSDQFPRYRIGIGTNTKPANMADYVLTNFSKGEQKILAENFKTDVFLLEEFISGGINKMLNANSRLSNNKKDSES